jgi:hypothetical protein
MKQREKMRTMRTMRTVGPLYDADKPKSQAFHTWWMDAITIARPVLVETAWVHDVVDDAARTGAQRVRGG